MKRTNAESRSIQGRAIGGGVVVVGVLFVLSLWAVAAGRHPESIESRVAIWWSPTPYCSFCAAPRECGLLVSVTPTWAWRSRLGRLSALCWGRYTSSITSSNSLCRSAAALAYSFWELGRC